jgi:hypothetical protein
MVGISEENVVEHVEGTAEPPGYDWESAVTIRYNRTGPTIISDGNRPRARRSGPRQSVSRRLHGVRDRFRRCAMGSRAYAGA